MKTRWIIALVLAAFPLAIYAPSLSHAFVYDDLWTIVHNPAILRVFPIGRFFFDAQSFALAASGMSLDIYRPLSTLSFAVDNALVGLAPAWFRAVNMALHILNGWLCWKWLRTWTGKAPAAVGALIFLVHPVQVESVVWITQRSNLLCGAFCLTALYFWRGADVESRRAWWAVAALVIACLSKETAVVLPALFALQLTSKRDKRWAACAASFAIAFSYWALRRAVVGHWAQPPLSAGGYGLKDGLVALALYAKNLAWPLHLNVSYVAPESVAWGDFAFLGGLVAALALGVGTAVAVRSKSPAAVGFAVLFLFWLPHSGLVSRVTFAADRFLYLPMIGVALIAASFSNRRWAHAFAAGLVVSLAAVSFVRTSDWRDELSLWTASVRENGKNSFALACYAQELEKRGRIDEAVAAYDQSLQNRPNIRLAANVLDILIKIAKQRGDQAAQRRWEEKRRSIPPDIV